MQILKCFSSRQLISSHIQNFWWVSLYTVQHRQYNKIKLSFMTSIALLYKHCTSWGQKVSEHSDGHPCWKIIPIFFSRFFWLNGRERAIWWRYNVPHYYSFYCPNSFMIETLLLQHSALKFELSVISNVLGLSDSMITSKDTKSVPFWIFLITPLVPWESLHWKKKFKNVDFSCCVFSSSLCVLFWEMSFHEFFTLFVGFKSTLMLLLILWPWGFYLTKQFDAFSL